MAASGLRTVTVVTSKPTTLYGSAVQGQPLRWPVAEPDENLDYLIDVTALLADVSDALVSASWAISPSNELSAYNLSVAGGLITCWQAGGVPGRDYVVKIDIATQAGRTFSRLVKLAIDANAGSAPLPPTTPGFGTALTWPASIIMGDLLGADGASLLGADGAYLTSV